MPTSFTAQNGRPAPTTRSTLVLAPAQTPATLAQRLELPYAFAETVVSYLLLVLPSATSELASWRTRAAEIPNPKLRHHALQALRKRGNIEGAALFATLAPAAQRRRTIRALVAFQAAYNYLDMLAEQPSADPEANAGQLHRALRWALEVDVARRLSSTAMRRAWSGQCALGRRS